MKGLITLVFSIFVFQFSFGQEAIFSVDVTADSILYGNPLQVKYTLENTQGDFQPPSFEGFDIIGGPNTSSQYSMVNGVVSQKASYEYILMPIEEGLITLASAKLENGEGIMETGVMDIVVLPNPDGIIQQSRGYGYNQQLTLRRPQKELSPQDSLKLKLRNLKSTKI